MINNNHALALNRLTTDIISRVVYILVKGNIGSGYVTKIGLFNYIVTAKHIFSNCKNLDSVQLKIFQDGTWIEYNSVILLHQNEAVDVAVVPFKTNIFDQLANPIITSANVVIGDDGYFLGFPLQLLPEGEQVNGGRPVPLIKRATLSGELKYNSALVWILDGHCTRGFSGGPAFFKAKTNNHWQFFGIISGYFPQKNLISDHIREWEYDENSGLIICYASNYVIEILKQNKL
jgi:hypothetical protein